MKFSANYKKVCFSGVLALSLSLACILAPVLALDTAGKFPYQNAQVEKLALPNYGLSDLTRLENLLYEHNTFKLRRYSSGGHSAVTVSDDRSLEKALDGMLILHWDRDNIMQALAEKKAAGQYGIAQGQWRRGLDASILHHFQYRGHFIETIAKADEDIPEKISRPHIRYNPVSLQESSESWGHAQNDALSFIGYLLFRSLNEGSPALDKKQLSYAVLLPLYFDKIDVSSDFDLGAWEDKRAEHASSIGAALSYLLEERQYVEKHGALSLKIGDKTYKVDKELLDKLIEKCRAKLKEILPNEYVRADASDTRADKSAVRPVDAALVNALILGSLSGKPVVDDAMALTIIDNIENKLMGKYGIARYPRDIWDGRVDRKDLKEREEAQWCHVSPMISVVFGEMYRRTGKEEYFKRQVEHFNRGLSHINERFNIPEAYIVDPQSRRFKCDENEPLAWAQSVTLLSLLDLKESINYANKRGKGASN